MHRKGPPARFEWITNPGHIFLAKSQIVLEAAARQRRSMGAQNNIHCGDNDIQIGISEKASKHEYPETC
jgi:hypothetical protein